MTGVPIPFPLGGISDTYSFEDQPPGTTTDAQNVRSTDPSTNRIRGGQREGMERYLSSRLNVSGKVSAMAVVTSDQRRVSYADGSGSLEWDDTNPSKESCPAVAVDRQGNSYWLDGKASIIKRNSEGEEVWRFAVPVADEAHVLRALRVDDLDHIYVAVSEGGKQSEARIFCFAHDLDRKLIPFWSAPIVAGGYVTEMRVVTDKLYTVQNFDDSQRSYIVVYENVWSSVPSVAWKKNVLYPVNGLAVKDNGEVVTAHPPSATPYYDSRATGCTQILDEPRWTPLDLDRYDERVRCWFSADTIKDQPGYEQIRDGQAVREWIDHGPKGRILFEDRSDPSFKQPLYVEHGLGFRPGVKFLGDDYRLISGVSADDTKNSNDTNGTLWPNRRGCLMLLVVKPAQESRLGRIIGQMNDSGSATREVYANATGGGVATTGRIGTNTGAVASPPANSTAFSSAVAQYDNDNSVAIITILFDNDYLSSPSNFGVFRVNGAPVGYTNTTNFWSDSGESTAVGCRVDGSDGFKGDIYEILVLEQYNDGSGEVVATAPAYNASSVTPPNAVDADSDTEVERLEWWAAVKYGVGHLLDKGSKGSQGVTWGTDGPQSNYEHPFSLNSAASGSVQSPLGYTDSWDATLLSGDQVMAKWSPARGNVKWAYASAGLGYAVEADGDSLYTVGPTLGADTDTVKMWTDAGGSASETWNAASATTLDYDYEYPKCAVDEYGNFWVPYHWSGEATPYSVIGYTSAGSTVLNYALGSDQLGYAVALPPTNPDYSTNVTAITRPEFLYVATRNESDETIEVSHKLRLVTVTQANSTTRATEVLVACGTALKHFDSTGVLGASSGGSTALSSTARYVGMAALRGKVYVVDGVNSLVFDPVANTVSRWKATDGGEVPQRYKLITSWRGRIVLARGSDDPQNWAMSEQDDAHHWDMFPPQGLTPGQAVIGNGGVIDEVKAAPDVITTVIPYNRETLLFGCDASIYGLIGDPTAGGYLGLISDQTGMAFGAPWCKDPDGNLYFVGNRGEVYVMSGVNMPRKISRKVDRRLRDIDWSANRVELQWDSDGDKLRLFVVPYGSGGSMRTSWVWERETDSWWPDVHGDETVQPTCSVVMDGDDPTDRVILVGCEDGYVRNYSRMATTDDGYAIDSYVTIGPFSAGSSGVRLRNPKITLADTQSGCHFEMFASDTPDNMGSAREFADLNPGQNPRILKGVRGSYAWLRLRNAASGQRWAYESGLAELYDSGRRLVL